MAYGDGTLDAQIPGHHIHAIARFLNRCPHQFSRLTRDVAFVMQNTGYSRGRHTGGSRYIFQSSILFLHALLKPML